jgi:hypothetical protein
MITKIFLFQFVNSYASFFYLAFVAEHFGDCPESGCMSVLAINLAIIFGSRLATGNLMELLIPYLSYQYKYSKQMVLYGDKISRPEKEHMLDPVSTRILVIALRFFPNYNFHSSIVRFYGIKLRGLCGTCHSVWLYCYVRNSFAMRRFLCLRLNYG